MIEGSLDDGAFDLIFLLDELALGFCELAGELLGAEGFSIIDLDVARAVTGEHEGVFEAGHDDAFVFGEINIEANRHAGGGIEPGDEGGAFGIASEGVDDGEIELVAV